MIKNKYRQVVCRYIKTQYKTNFKVKPNTENKLY